MKIFDAHVHYPWWEYPIREDEIYRWLDDLGKTCDKAGIVKIALLGWPPFANEAVALALQERPDLVIGMAMVDLDVDRPEIIREYKDRGFTGLKIIKTAKDYDHPDYYRFYEQAELLKMPIIFHTGIIGGPVDYLAGNPDDFPQGVDEEKLIAKLKDEAMQGQYGKSSARMQPIFLDTIATYFPKLFIIGAHLGWPDYMTSCAVARFRPRLFFDISGGGVVRRHILEGGYIGKEIRQDKLVFGSDCDLKYMQSELQCWKDAFDEMGMDPLDQEKIFYKNAARIFAVAD